MTAAGFWDARIRRAEKLSEKFPASREILAFYGVIAKFQCDLQSHFASTRAPHPLKIQDGSIRGRIDAAALSKRFPAFLSVVEAAAPSPLAEFARALHGTPDTWEALLQNYWESVSRFEPFTDEQSSFFARAYLQPYAEYLSPSSHTLRSQRLECNIVRYADQCRRLAFCVLRVMADGGRWSAHSA